MFKDKPKIQPSEKPSLYNDEAIIGAGIGNIAIGMPLGIGLGLMGVPFAGPLSLGAGLAVGGLIGGSIGKSRMEEESQYGKEVKSPTLFNKKLFSGGFGGMIVGDLIAAAAMAGATIAGVTFAAPVLLGLVALPLVTGAIGAVMGSISGKNQMEEEHNQAMSQLADYQRQPSKGLTLEITQEPVVGKSTSHTQLLEQRRAAQTQQRGV